MSQNGRGFQGFGRGGRGEALMRAAENQLRRPGEIPPRPPTQGGTVPPGQPVPPAAPHEQVQIRASASSQVYQGGYPPQAPVQAQIAQPPITPQSQLTYPPPISQLGAQPPMAIPAGPQGATAPGFGRGLSQLASVASTAESLSKLTIEPPPVGQVDTPSSGFGTLSVSTPSQLLSPTVQVSSSPSDPTSGHPASNSNSSPSQTDRPQSHTSQTSRRPYTGIHTEEGVSSIGTVGTRTKMSANYIRVKSTTGGVYHFIVKFSPEIDSKNMRYKLLNMHREVIGETREFNRTTLYAPKVITEGCY